MKIKFRGILSMLLVSLFIITPVLRAETQKKEAAQRSWKDIKTVSDVCKAYPERMKTMLGSLNLELKGLEKVKSAYQNGNIEAACQALLEYYNKGNTAAYLRKELPSPSKNRDTEADSILQHIYVFQESCDKVPVKADGHLDWTWKGRLNDIEWAWALNRHYHIRTLLSAYNITGNIDYAKAINNDIKDWIISSLPYPAKKSSTEMWRGLEVSFRAKVWTNVFYNLMKSKELEPATRLLILTSIPEHAHYARNFHAQGNWLTMELSGLATVAAAWPEFKESPSWIAYAKQTMTKSLQDQVYPDGVQTELTSSYHKVALDNFNLFFETCKQVNEPLPDIYPQYLERMWNYLAYTMRPDGYGLLNNDADLMYNRESVMKSAAKYNRPDWEYIASNGEKGKKPEGQPSVIFPWAGQIIMKSGYDKMAQWSFFDIGPWGTGHQHNDKLNITVAAYGRDLLVDAGRFAYRGEFADKFRPYATGSFGHNVVLVNGKGQSRGPVDTKVPLDEKNYKITPEFDYAWNSFDSFTGTEGKFVHNRAVLYVRGKFWVVVDRLGTDRPRKIETMWHWHPDNIVFVKDNIAFTGNESGNLQIIPSGQVSQTVKLISGQEKPEPQGWYSREYNMGVPNPVAIYSATIEKDATMVWVLYPSEKKTETPVVKLLSEDDHEAVVNVTIRNGENYEVKIPYSDPSGATIKKK
jgi:hypothetical protein